MAKIFIVMGSCGDYSDYNEWHVIAYRDRARAETHVARANELNNELERQETEKYDTPEFKRISAENHRLGPPPEYDWNQRDLYFKSNKEYQAIEAEYRKYWDDWHKERANNVEMNMLDPRYKTYGDHYNWPSHYAVSEVELAEEN